MVLAGVFAGVLSLSFATPAQAEGPGAKPDKAAAAAGKPDMAVAKKAYGEGEKKFKAGDFVGAEADFKTANDVKSTPQAERYLGLCEDAQHHYAAAAEWFDKFVAHVPDKLASQGDEVRKRLGEIKAMPGKVHLESNPSGASVTVDDKALAAPTPTDVELAPGAHTLKLTHAGNLPATKSIDVAFASEETVTTDLEAEPPPPPPAPPPVAAAAPPPPAPPPPPPPEPRSKIPAFVTGGLAIVAAGVGTAFGIIALGDKSDFDKNPTTQTADNGDTHALIADMSFGVALTFGVTSAVLFLTKDDTAATPAATSKTSQPAPREAKQTKQTKRSALKLTPTPIVGPHTGGAGLLVQF